MPLSDEYRGVERRVRNERDIEVDRRLADLTHRIQHVEELLVNDGDPDAGLVSQIHKIKHELNNNSLVTNASSRHIREVKESVEGLVTFMGTFEALNRIALFGERLIKRVVPTLLALSAGWTAITVFWKGRG